MAAEPNLIRLTSEWQNRGVTDEMTELEQRILSLKREMSYEEVWKRLALKEERRHVGNLDYVAMLMYLIDERRICLISLQRTIFMQQGHLYRALRRYGVKYKAATSLKVSVEDSMFPWAGEVYHDPLLGGYWRGGEFHAAEYQIDPEPDNGRRFILVGLDEDPVDVPLPLWRKKKK